MPDNKKSLSRRRLRLLWVIGGLALGAAFLCSILTVVFRANAPTEAQKRPPEALTRVIVAAEPVAAAPVKRPSRPAPVPIPAPGGTQPPIYGYDDYLQFQVKKNPGDRGSALWLELEELIKKNEIPKQWSHYFRNFETKQDWRPGEPLSSSQARWLQDQRKFFALLQRAIDAGGPAYPTPAQSLELVKGFPKTNIIYPNILTFQLSAKLLAAESQRLRKADDLEGAADAIARQMAWGPMLGNATLIGYLVQDAVQKIGSQTLFAWVVDGPPSAPLALRLQAAFDAAHRPASQLLAPIAMDLLLARRSLVSQLDAPLSGQISGIMTESFARPTRAGFQNEAVNFMASMTQQASYVAGGSFRVIQLKTNAARVLQECDALTSRSLAHYAQPYVKLGASRDWLDRQIAKTVSNYNPLRKYLQNFDEYFARAAGEADVNLARAGLRLLHSEWPAPGAGPGQPDWPRSPWRDPFTEKPLKILMTNDGATTRALVYSIGPDLKDQLGALAYDPTNGSLSEGDLRLGVPLPPRRAGKDGHP